MSLEDESDIPTKNTECVLNEHIKQEFVIFIIYYTFNVNLMNIL